MRLRSFTPCVPPKELTAPASTNGPLDANDFLFDPLSVRLYQVRDIICIQPRGRGTNYTLATLANGKTLTIRKSLAQIIPRLPSFFFLVRRGWVINLYHVRDMAVLNRRMLRITLSDLSEVLISRNQLLALGRERGL